tara:strand:- start:197 stop:1090 length:894 start_codon:yes stop_codon:yes gene_type:complete
MIKIYLILIFLLSIIFLSFINDIRKNLHSNFIVYETKDNDFNFPKFKEEREIPKIIRRNYGLKDKKSDLKKYEFIFEETKKLDPDIKEELLFGREEMEKFILKYYNQEVLDTINLINPNYAACVSDILRLLVIYAKGGVYMDVKTQIISKISDDLELYNDKMIVSHFCSIPFVFNGWTQLPPYGEISNWFFAAPRGHPVLRECILQGLTNIREGYKEREKFTDGRSYVLSMTGPHMITPVIKNSKNYDKVQVLSSMSPTKFILSGWNGKLRKEAYNLDNDAVQKGTHWKQLNEPLFN